MAARRDGRPHAGLGPDPRRNDGHRGRLPDRPVAPLVALAPGVQVLIAVTGSATALLAASIALTQNDLKRVMAYSTVSQLGYMFMALGSGVGNVAQLAVVAAMFHLFTHAFFKALLFLASGSVMHAMGDVIDMRRFRGLRHRLPYTHLTFAAGGLALAGIFPMAGFFSKDEILLAIKSASQAPRAGLGLGLLLDLLGGYRDGVHDRLLHGPGLFLTFWGPEKLPSPDDPEAPPDCRGRGSSAGTPAMTPATIKPTAITTSAMNRRR